MNSRVSLAIVLGVGGALGGFLSHAVPQVQAQAPAPRQSLDAKVAHLEARVDALQAEVNQLKLSQAVSTPSQNVSPFYRLPPVPRQSNIPPVQVILLGQTAH